MAAEVGLALGLSAAERKQLRLAGLIHDVGMMTLPHNIADAGQPLSEEEMSVVKQHARIGREIALAANFDVVVQNAILHHHERMDGSGYAGLHGDQVSIEARILAVCEVFDSMTHREYYGGRSTLEDAVTELRDNAGTLYDRDVIRALLGHLNTKVASAALNLGPELAFEAEGPAKPAGVAPTDS